MSALVFIRSLPLSHFPFATITAAELTAKIRDLISIFCPKARGKNNNYRSG